MERRVDDIGAAGPLDAATERLLGVRALPPTRPLTGLGWEIVPEGLTRQLLWVRERYGDIPHFIGEMGASFEDTPNEDGNGSHRL